MYWKVPHMWEKGEVWILGGGSSLPRQFGVPEEKVQEVLLGKASPSIYSPYMSGIYKKHVIAVNAAYLIGNWMDIIFFGDCPWFLDNEENLAKHTALKVTNHPKIVRPWVKLLKRDDRTESYGLHSSSDTVYWNGNSGAGAINLAALTGAKKIILVGFDMNIINSDESHWHNLYNTRGFSKEQMKRNAEAAFIKFLVCFPKIAEDAKEMGIEIINASPTSAIKEFPKVTVKELL